MTLVITDTTDHTHVPDISLEFLQTGRCDMQELVESQQFHFWQHKSPGPPKPRE